MLIDLSKIIQITANTVDHVSYGIDILEGVIDRAMKTLLLGKSVGAAAAAAAGTAGAGAAAAAADSTATAAGALKIANNYFSVEDMSMIDEMFKISEPSVLLHSIFAICKVKWIDKQDCALDTDCIGIEELFPKRTGLIHYPPQLFFFLSVFEC
jgi:hypothetical protein